jgi:hypothetical protein
MAFSKADYIYGLPAPAHRRAFHSKAIKGDFHFSTYSMMAITPPLLLSLVFSGSSGGQLFAQGVGVFS